MQNEATIDQLLRFGEKTALELSSEKKCSGRTVAKRAEYDLKKIVVSVRFLKEDISKTEREWLTDNGYIAEQAAVFAAECFSHQRSLPAGKGKKIPLICAAAERLVFKADLSEDRLKAFLTGFQRIRPFSEKELSLLFPSLNAALLKKLAFAAGNAAAIGKKTEAHEEHRASADELRKIFESFRALDGIDAEELILEQSSVERIFSNDAVYREMAPESRALYRRRLASIAKKKRMPEKDAALSILEKCRAYPDSHIGSFLFEARGKRASVAVLTIYLFFVLGLSFVLAVLLAVSYGAAVIAPVVFFPLSEIFKSFADSIVSRIKKPVPLPRMLLQNGIPDSAAALAVISCIPRSATESRDLVRKLEYYSIANRDSGKNLLCGLLLDLPEARTSSTSNDELILTAAQEGISNLNLKYGDRFFFFTRPRIYNRGTGTMCGRERKRGALEDLVKLITGAANELSVSAGDAGKLERVKYLILLDSDTKLTIGSAKKLVGTMLHPLAKPVIDETKRAVINGHGMIAPALSVDLENSNASFFASVFGGQGGTEPYSFSRSDIYQDLFDRGSFSGKGMVSVEAYAKCLLDRFPPNTVLSHDLPEGEILHCGFADDIELTDGFPSSPRSYLKRIHRWTRGDWQNIIFLGKKVQDSSGSKTFNSLDMLSKWKIIDNLRRSLVDPACFFAFLFACLVGSEWVCAAVTAALAILFPALSAGVNSALRAKKGREYRSRVIYGVGSALIRSFISFVILSQKAFTELSAALTALFRLTVSRRKLLEWTTAAEAENDKKTIANVLISMLPTLAAGIFFLFSGPEFLVPGLIWLISPALLYTMGKREKQKELKPEDKDYLLSEAGRIWSYFEQFLTKERGWLPPDNWQEEPALGAAERTSPTNIGFAVLSVLSACELSFISRDKACELCAEIVGTLEKLEKRNGHLYNWYDLKTLRPMRPLFVSTVDSGNLAACLTAAVTILMSFGRNDLVDRFKKVRDGMDFKVLYDEKRDLFRIGINEKDEPEGYYDLFASEARLTSYYACARGICPPKHWRTLGRPMAYASGRLGAASWNGSVFEYFMPELLLPLYRNSLIWESLRFCAAAQIAANVPWGMSESAFASIDDSGCYRYKAHGVQNAALRRRVFEDRVIAPYASFLLLPLWPLTAVKNLKRFDRLGAKGRFGSYEALDYTEKRLSPGEDFIPIKCFMVHHLGMSLAAAVNALHKGFLVNAFFADPEMASFAELLQEKGPVGKRLTTADKTKIVSAGAVLPDALESGADGADAAVLSNGVYSLLMTSDGVSSSSCGDTALTLFDRDGTSCMMFISNGEKVYPLTGAKDADTVRSFEHALNEASLINEIDGIRIEMRCQVPEEIRGEVRRIRIFNPGKSRTVEISFYLDPVLSPSDAYLSHPAFSKLSMNTKAFSNGVTVMRRPGGAVRATSMSIASSRPFTYDTSREFVIGKYGTVSGALADKAASSEGDVLDPCVLLRSSLRLETNGSSEIIFAVAFAEDAESSERAANSLILHPATASRFLFFAANECFPDRKGTEYVGKLLLSYLFPASSDIPSENETVGQKDLWSIGVSGDLPTAYVEASNERSVKSASIYMSAAKYLRMSGFKCDLIVICSEPDGYSRPVASALYDEYERLGRPQGVFITSNTNAHKIKCLASKAGSYAHRPPMQESAKRPATEREWHFENGAFLFETKTSCGSPAWSHILTNGRLGWLVTDCGTFGLWFDNAREKRLLRWKNDPVSTEGVEKLSLVRGSEEISLFAARDSFGCLVAYAPGYAVWEKQIGQIRSRVTGCVHHAANARIIEIEISGNTEEDLIKWYAEPFPLEKPYALRPVTKKSSDKSVVFTDHDSGLKLKASFSEKIAVLPDGSVVFHPGAKTRFILSCGDETGDVELETEDTARYWESISRKDTYITPYRKLEDYMKGWCLYQILACRILARSSIYQCGGAIGFRDQLQDVVSVADVFPDIAEQHILEAASHQYAEGDVMHWWHRGENGERNKGVRTKCSDDLLWLPWAACRYAEIVGNTSVFEREADWLVSERLKEGEADRYEQAIGSGEASSIFEHCLRAVRLVNDRGTGKLGLLKIGRGDWNDGMNAVGAEGKGESVWLTFFAAYTARELSAVASKIGKTDEAEELYKLAVKWGNATDHAWDEDRYLRGSTDEGELLGSRYSSECCIDLLTQSWAVLSGFGDPAKCDIALDTCLRELCDIENGIIKLFDPPFDGKSDPGYIRSYLPGVRENGGRYTHAAIWFAMALFKAGRTDVGARILLSLLPKPEDPRYKIEPYVLAADVYSNRQNYARGGWSWYTGSAGWYRTAVRDYLLPSLDKAAVNKAEENNSLRTCHKKPEML